MITLRTTLACAALAAAAALPASAASPIRIVVDLEGTFPLPRLSAACGFPVWRHDSGRAVIQLFRDRSGAGVVRELDTVPGYRATFFSPVELGGTGGQFDSIAPAPFSTTYPAGISIGAPADTIFTGLQLSVPGFPMAGRQVSRSEIVFIEDGVPFVDLVEIVSEDGHFVDAATLAALRCAALAAP